MAKQGTKAWIKDMRKAGRLGGKARALVLSAERRSEIARQGGRARHPKVLDTQSKPKGHTGNGPDTELPAFH